MDSGDATINQPPPVDPRALMADWLRSLTLVCEGRGVDETLALIADANQPTTHMAQLDTTLSAADAHALDRAFAWYREVRSQQAGVNLVIEQQLINWLAEATGTTPSIVVQRLAGALSGLT